MPTQTINLTNELNSFVKAQIAQGHYKNASEVHQAALSLLALHEENRQLRMEKLRQEVQLGLDDIKAGRFTEYESPEYLVADICQ